MSLPDFQELIARAIAVRDTWLSVARILRTRQDKAVEFRPRLCLQRAHTCERIALELRKQEEESEEVLVKAKEDLEIYTKRLNDLAEQADRAMIQIGLSGHDLKEEEKK